MSFESCEVVKRQYLYAERVRVARVCVDSLPTPRRSIERGMASHPAGGRLWYKVLYTFRYKKDLVQSF